MDITEADEGALIANPRIRRFVEYWRSKRGEWLITRRAMRLIRSISATCLATWC